MDPEEAKTDVVAKSWNGTLNEILEKLVKYTCSELVLFGCTQLYFF